MERRYEEEQEVGGENQGAQPRSARLERAMLGYLRDSSTQVGAVGVGQWTCKAFGRMGPCMSVISVRHRESICER